MEMPVNQVLVGDNIEIMNDLPEHSIDLIFADPPYNLQIRNVLRRPDNSIVNGVKEEWDWFDSFDEYDEFTTKWLRACRRLLKTNGTLWVIGTYHNIYRVGTIMQNLGFWILNDVIWIKTNPMPNFRGARFTNAHETLIWAAYDKNSKYTFNYQEMKRLNGGKQMRSDWWLLSLASGKERLKNDSGKKLHPTQKPESLLYRIILSSSKPGDVVLDPFFGTGTTGVVAEILSRKWIGIEKDRQYADSAMKRIESNRRLQRMRSFERLEKSTQKNLSAVFAELVETGLLRPGQTLFFKDDKQHAAIILPDARLRTFDGYENDIFSVSKHYANGQNFDIWSDWKFFDGRKYREIGHFLKILNI